MQAYRFNCAVRADENGNLYPLPWLVTPTVMANTPTEAIHSDTVKQFCEDNKCTVYRMVR